MNGPASVPWMSEQQRKKHNASPTAMMVLMTLNWGALAWVYSGTARLGLSLPFPAQATSVLPPANARGSFQRLVSPEPTTLWPGSTTLSCAWYLTANGKWGWYVGVGCGASLQGAGSRAPLFEPRWESLHTAVAFLTLSQRKYSH